MRWLFVIFGLATNFGLYSQNIGVGTSSPAGKLQINHRSTLSFPGLVLMDSTSSRLGNLRFRNIGTSKYIELYGYTGSPFSNQTYLDVQSDSVFIATFRGNGNFGIRTTNPIVPLDVNGEIRSTTLAGTGKRPLFATASGIVSTSEVYDTSTVSVGPKAFTHFGSTAFTLFSNTWRVYMTSGSTFDIHAHINFPDKVRLTKMKVMFMDNSSSDLVFEFLSSPVGGPGTATFATVTTSGASSLERSIEVNVFHTVNNSDNFYAISVSPAAGSTWQGSVLYVKGVLFTYVYQ